MTDRDTTSDPADESCVDTDDGSGPVPTADPADSRQASDVLTAIADPDCRAILAASAERSVSVADVVDECDIPTATAYRKVNMLADAGLLDERIQIRPYGRNEREYSLRVDTVHVQLAADGPPEARVTISGEGAGRVPGQALTDGGEATADEQEEHGSGKLGSIFVDVTGTEEVVAEQDDDGSTRQLTDDGSQSVSEYVSAVTRDDGLSDSLPEPDGQSQE